MTPIEHYIKTHTDTPIDINDIERVVCKEMGITRRMLRSHTRKGEIPIARFMCFHFTKYINKKDTLTKIGKRYGKDHTTVIHGIKTLDNLVQTNGSYRDRFNKIKLQLT